MSDVTMNSALFTLGHAKKGLNWSVKSWFAIALAGQWMFAVYVFFMYGYTLYSGIDIEKFSPASGMRNLTGIDKTILFTHIVPAIYLALFGLLQLVPAIRNRFKTFHRYNGRVFLLLGLSGAITGLYLQLSKDVTFSQGIVLNGLLILIAVGCAWYYAITKRIDLHQRWAIHAFILVNGVWTFRLYLMGWYLVNQGPNGNTPNVDGPMDVALSYLCYLLPMAIAELYFWLKQRCAQNSLWIATVVMSIGAVITLIGVIAATTMMWAPRILQVLAAG